MPGPTDLHTQAVEILDAAVAALDTIPLYDPALDGAPDRAFVSPGAPSIDCCPGGGQLTVHVDRLADAFVKSGLEQGKLRPGKKNHVSFVITMARCVVDRRTSATSQLTIPPFPDDQQETAAQTDADAWAIWNHLYNLWRADALFTLCGEVFFEIAQSLPQSGGCTLWQMVIRASLDGYESVSSS